jgi:hypothetical protein
MRACVAPEKIARNGWDSLGDALSYHKRWIWACWTKECWTQWPHGGLVMVGNCWGVWKLCFFLDATDDTDIYSWRHPEAPCWLIPWTNKEGHTVMNTSNPMYIGDVPYFSFTHCMDQMDTSRNSETYLQKCITLVSSLYLLITLEWSKQAGVTFWVPPPFGMLEITVSH